ncbi:MAG: hypothetical protein CM1200mP18_17500 [Gammaproteobacteria bacterium]|nr:MAG: hypothetical protein CM1200mP18_17500 [Gammaproteobacteria bacterium]
MTADAREWRPLKGIALSVLGIGFITFNDAMMKLVVEQHPIGEAIFVRGLFALVPMAFLIYRAGGLRSLAITIWACNSGLRCCWWVRCFCLFSR